MTLNFIVSLGYFIRLSNKSLIRTSIFFPLAVDPALTPITGTVSLSAVTL